MSSVLQYIIYLAVLVALAIPLGSYIGKVMNGERVWLTPVLAPVERGIYRLLHIDAQEEMPWKKYALCVVLFNGIGFVFLFLLLLGQGFLPLDPEGLAGNSWHLAFNTAASFVTNTNWQAYAGESSLSYLTQMLGRTVQNFVSAACGIAVLFALIRAFVKVQEKGLGSFWADMTRVILYILLPLSIVLAVGIASQGVPQTFAAYDEVELLEPYVADDGTVVTQEVVPLGPAASQIAIKQLGTNGGGFFGVNSAHPFENPTIVSNLLEMISILLIPAALCFTFGRNVKDKRQGRAIFAAMFILLVLALTGTVLSETQATPQLMQSGAVDITTLDQPGGNMEGKEVRFGIPASVTWATFTTAASNGSVNAMHDSFTPLGSSCS